MLNIRWKDGTRKLNELDSRSSDAADFTGSGEISFHEGLDVPELLFQPGQIFAEKYEMIDMLGSGGMGVIYRARHLILDKILAIKVLHNVSADHNLIMRFQREAKAASSISHVNVITVYDFGIIDGVKPYMVMDYLPGRTLAEVLEEQGSLSVRATLDIADQVLAALAHAHKKGILHRDLKPGNIMLVQEAEDDPILVKILDFGLAKLVDRDDQVSLSQVGAAMGSPAYMSPEQASGMKVDQRADLYSLGCVIFELLSGQPPLLGDSPIETLLNRMKEEAPSVRDVCQSMVRSKEYRIGKEVPTILDRFVAKLLAKEPRDRFQSATEARSYLSTIWEYVDQSGSSERGHDSSHRRSGTQARKTVKDLQGLRNSSGDLPIAASDSNPSVQPLETVQNQQDNTITLQMIVDKTGKFKRGYPVLFWTAILLVVATFILVFSILR